MEEVFNSILQSSLVAALLGAGLVFVHRHHVATIKKLEDQISAMRLAHAEHVKLKDAVIHENSEELKEMVRDNIAIETRLLDALKTISNGRN